MSELLRQVPALAYSLMLLGVFAYGLVTGFGWGMVWERWFRERFEGWKAKRAHPDTERSEQ